LFILSTLERNNADYTEIRPQLEKHSKDRKESIHRIREQIKKEALNIKNAETN
jgi:hypothetical protein